MKRIGLIVAVEMEAGLQQYGKAEVMEQPGYSLLKYSAPGYTLLVLHCGVGEIAAAAGTQLLISRFDVDVVVNFGVVGGLTPEMGKTRVCAVEKVVHYDFDTSEADGWEVGRYEGYESRYIPADRELLSIARQVAPELKPVVCASGDKFVGDPEKKRALHRDFGADICEMEAAGILLTCNRNRVPCLMIKAVSDGIEGGAEEFKSEILRSSKLCLEITDRIIHSINQA